MIISQEGIALIKQFEGLKLIAYKDMVGVLTIGYGHTGPDVMEGLHIDSTKAIILLEKDLTKAEGGVNLLVRAPLKQCQFDALVCFTFNLGIKALESRTLLTELNNRHYTEAANQFLRGDHAGKNVEPGLLRRRSAERDLFLKEGV